MEPPAGKSGAQRRVDRICAFREELEELAREGALELTAEQRTRLDAHLDETTRTLAERFDVDITASQRQISWGMRIASTIAGAALCAAAVLFFYRIWGHLGTWMQVALLMAAPVAAVGATEFCARRERTYYYTSLFAILACAAAVLNLQALATMFNVLPTPNGFLVWALFAGLLAYAYRLRLILAGALVCAIGFLVMTVLRGTGLDWAAVDQRMEAVAGAGLLVAAAPAVSAFARPDEFPWVYRMVGLLTAFLGISVGTVNGSQTYLPFHSEYVEVFYQAAGFVTAALVMRYGVRSATPGIVNLGALFFALFLYMRLIDWWWDWMPRYVFFLLVGLISLGLLFAFQRLRRGTRKEVA